MRGGEMNTLILYFHPEHERSHANRALIEAAAAVDGVTVTDMYALYPGGVVDVEAEVIRLFTADRLILQFPIHWYAPPPLLQAWQNSVLTRMFYIKAAEEGERIRDLPLMVAATAGNVPEAYKPTGINLFSLEDLLHPLHATASRCALKWVDPFLVYRANRLSPEERGQVAQEYAARIAQWTDRIPAKT
jgi:putative NADPH-quinone reductase